MWGKGQRMADKSTTDGFGGAGMLSVFIVTMAVTIWKNGGINSLGTGDTLMFGAFILLMVWFLLPRRGLQQAKGQHPRQSLAFRFGKALNSVRRPR